MSFGVLAKAFPVQKVKSVLTSTGKGSVRERDLPAHVVVYYVMALALYMQASYREVLRCLLEGVQWLLNPAVRIKVTGKSGISQARTRLGVEPLRQLHDELVGPIATSETRGAWYRGWRLVSLDGSTMDVADEKVNQKAFGRPRVGRGRSAFPQLRFVSLVENGTHVLFGTQVGEYSVGERTLAKGTIQFLKQGMLCLADRYYYGFEFWNQARSTGAELLWRVVEKLRLPVEERLADGSYLSHIYPKDQRHSSKGVPVRVIEYELKGVPGAEAIYRLLTTVTDPDMAPASELAALYHERWEIETSFDELKTHLRGSKIVLRSKTPDLAQQEFYGLLMAHFAVRGLMHEAALRTDEDPDRLSFIHAVRVVRRKLPFLNAIPPREEGDVS